MDGYCQQCGTYEPLSAYLTWCALCTAAWFVSRSCEPGHGDAGGELG
jgi:hypothetical protein